RGAHRRPARIPTRGVSDETRAESGRPTRGQRRWSIGPATSTGFGAGITRRRDETHRAAHSGAVASYSHPPQPPRDPLGGGADRRRGGGYDRLANHLPDIRRALP